MQYRIKEELFVADYHAVCEKEKQVEQEIDNALAGFSATVEEKADIKANLMASRTKDIKAEKALYEKYLEEVHHEAQEA